MSGAVVDEPSRWCENPASALVDLMRQPAGERWVYRHNVRCPSCHAYWIVEVASPRGHVDPRPDPVRWGMACLCGRCEARRRALIVPDGKKPARPGLGGKFGRAWGEQDERNAWGMLRGRTREYPIRVERSPEPWDGSPLRDDKQAELDRILRREDGKLASVISTGAILALGLTDWPLPGFDA